MLPGRSLLLGACLLGTAATGCRAVLDLEPGQLAADAGTDTGGVSDTAPPGSGRRLAFVQASPDSPPLIPCAAVWPTLVALEGGAEAQLIQPFEPAAGLTFGGSTVVPVTGDLDTALGSARPTLFYFAPNDTGCKNALPFTRTETKRRALVPGGRVLPGMTEVVVAMGCNKGGSANGECGPSGVNFEVRAYDVQGRDPGAGRVGVQLLNASPFVNTGTGPPSFSNVDAYVQAFKGADKVEGPALVTNEGVTYGSLRPSAAPAFVNPTPVGAQYFLHVVAHGQPPCPSAPATTPTCPSVTAPLTSSPSDLGASLDNGHQCLFVLAGSPLGSPPNLKAIVVGTR